MSISDNGSFHVRRMHTDDDDFYLFLHVRSKREVGQARERSKMCVPAACLGIQCICCACV